MKQLTVLFLCFLFLEAGAQQPTVYALNDFESGLNADILFNPKNLNPARFSDTSLISADVVYQNYWIGKKSSPDGYTFSLESNIPGTRHGLGLQAQFIGNSDIKRRSVELFYNYRILYKGSLKLTIGAGFGWIKHIIEAPTMIYPGDIIISEEHSFNSPTADIGAFMQYGHHGLGLAYNNYLFNSYFKDSEGDKHNDVLATFAAYYSYAFRLSKKLNLKPELVYIKSKTEDILYLNTLLVINQKIRTGIYIDSEKQFGVMFSITLWKTMELGYGSDANTYFMESEASRLVYKAGVNFNKR
jgi:type IX secretion system PorP/SprF family membrane protein